MSRFISYGNKADVDETDLIEALGEDEETDVILGYVVGPNLQILMMYALGTVVGSVMIRWGTVGVSTWLAGNLYMLLVAPMTWTDPRARAGFRIFEASMAPSAAPAPMTV